VYNCNNKSCLHIMSSLEEVQIFLLLTASCAYSIPWQHFFVPTIFLQSLQILSKF